LEQKRWALMTEVQRLAAAEEQSRRTWETAAIDARRWLLRAVMLAGERQLELTVHNRGRAAEVKVSRLGDGRRFP
jgi:vacuolar-type H+-ATPase subunit D/Vma8